MTEIVSVSKTNQYVTKMFGNEMIRRRKCQLTGAQRKQLEMDAEKQFKDRMKTQVTKEEHTLSPTCSSGV